MPRFVITIDGPAASGKSTVARLLAKKLGAAFLDTGAMYRAGTLAALSAGADLTDEKQLLEVLDKTHFRFTPAPDGMRVESNGADITEKIRDPQVTANARYIAASALARERLVKLQRQFAQAHEKIVTEGRDQGTVAFPNADLKFYLTAALDERAERRKKDLKANGISQSLERIRTDIRQRDESDENRNVGPLKPADDAVIIDTTDLTLEEVVGKLVNFVKEKSSWNA